MLNIALEGLMAIGAFFGMAAAGLTNNIFLGALAAILSASLASMLMGLMTSKFRTNIFITGLAINMLAQGITAVLSQAWYHTKAVVAFDIPIDSHLFSSSISQLPLIGVLFSYRSNVHDLCVAMGFDFCFHNKKYKARSKNSCYRLQPSSCLRSWIFS